MATKHSITVNFKHKGVDKQRRMEVVSSSAKRYFNSLHQLAKVTKAERLVFDYLCEQMDVIHNTIFFSKELKHEIVSNINLWTTGKTLISTKSLPSMMNSLKNAQLVLRDPKNRGIYIINPKYFFKGNDRDRAKLIKKYIESRIQDGLPFHQLIDTTEDKFLEDI